MNKPLLNWWIRTTADLDQAMERQAVNVLLSWLIIVGWWLYLTSIVFVADPFTFISAMIEEERSAFLLISGIAFSLIGLIFGKGETVRTRTFFLLALWTVVMVYLFSALHPDHPLSAEEQQIADFALRLWQIHPGMFLGWFAWNSTFVLHFVFKNQRAKLKYWWWLFLGGLLLLAVIYTLSPALGLLYALLFPHETFLVWLKARSEKDIHLAGSKMSTAKEVNYQYRKQQDAEARKTREWVEFGGVKIPVSALVTHLMVIGSSGSGKSLTLRLLMQGCLPKVSPVTPCRGVVFDPKRTAYPDILGMEDISAEVIILNPFDARASSYDLAKDFTCFTHAESLAEILVPEGKGATDPIWYLAPRSLIVGVLVLFMNNAPGNWRFADLIRATDSLKLLTALLNSSADTKRYAEILGAEKTALNIYSSLRAEMDKFRSTAALWERCSTSISITQWLLGGLILLLGENEESRPAMKAINTLILTRMSQMLLAEGDCPEPRTFICLDELQSLHVESLQELATKGRSKGICLLLAFQSILGMYQMYGREIAESMLSQCRFKGFLKQSDQESAKWSAQAIGDTEIKRQQGSSNFEPILMGFTGISRRQGATEIIQQKNLVLPSEFINIPPINPITGQGLTGYYQVMGCHRHYEPWQSLKNRLHPSSEYVADFEPAPAHYQRLQPWTEADWERLGITYVMQRISLEEKLPHTDTDTGGWL
jgi:hypothetical protein